MKKLESPCHEVNDPGERKRVSGGQEENVVRAGHMSSLPFLPSTEVLFAGGPKPAV
jgi:hypothetical protein